MSGRTALQSSDSESESKELKSGTESKRSSQGNVEPSIWVKCCNCFGLACCIDENTYTHRAIAEVTQDNQRTCTDVPCLILFILVLISQFALLIIAEAEGADPELIFYGTDYKGRVCNEDNHKGKFAAWVDITESAKVRTCVSDCAFTEGGGNVTTIVEHYPSKEIFGAWCIPKTDWLKDQNTTKYKFDKAKDALQRGIADLGTTKWLILVSAIICVVISFIYIYLVSYIAKVVIWLSIFLIFLGGIIGSAWLIKAGLNDMKTNETETMGKAELGFGILLLIILFLLFLSLLWLRKRISLAFAMLHEASMAVRDMKSTIVFPLIYSIFVLGYFALWIASALYLFSVQVKDNEPLPSQDMIDTLGQETYVDYDFDRDMENLVWYNFAILLYVMQVILYFGYMVLAGAFSDWYFSYWNDNHSTKLRGDGVAELSKTPIIESFLRVLKFHIGSLAFGALLITIIRIIRGILLYVEKKFAKTSNPAAKCLFFCAQCCLKCCQCIINTINKDGFICTTIWGTNFCYSSLTAVKLIAANLARTVMVEGISNFMEIFGRITIAFLTTGFCVLILDNSSYFKEHVSSILFPIILIFLISYLIGSLFMMIYEVAVETIFICFLVDEQAHNGTPKFAHSTLKKHAEETQKLHSESDETELQPV